MNIKTIVADFADQLSAIIHSQATERARAAVLSALGVAPRRGPGRPPKAATTKATAVAPAVEKVRKKAPRQLCPVPGCKNPAAPIFGMVCAKHKDVPKAQIKKYREARKAKKLGLPTPKAGKRRATKKATAKKPTTAKKLSPRKPFPKKGAPKTSPKSAVAAQAAAQATPAAA